MSVTELHPPPVAGDDVETTDEPVAEVPAEEEPKPTPPMQIPMPGYDGISVEFGGAAPEFSEVRLLGGKMPIDGHFPKGAEIELVVKAKVTAVEGVDFTDDWGKVQRTVRRHKARLISVRRTS